MSLAILSGLYLKHRRTLGRAVLTIDNERCHLRGF